MTGADNISVVLYCYLRTLSVKVSRDTVHRLLSTPLGGGMRGISDALDALHIKNEDRSACGSLLTGQNPGD